MKTTSETLYKWTSKGQLQEWTIHTENNIYWTTEGITGGKLTTSTPTVCKGKNIGRKNETTSTQQAVKEADAKFRKKVDEGYVLKQNLKTFEASNPKGPMLAFNVEDYKDIPFTERTFVQPKLDGIRCLSTASGLISRNGKPITSCNHIPYPGYELDGELYNHDLKDDFNEIVSLVKKKSPTAAERSEIANKIKLYVYDAPSFPGKFSERFTFLKRLGLAENSHYSQSHVLVPTYEVHSWGEIEIYNNRFLEEGYEGTIIRTDLGDYENKRSKQLLKYKQWQDDEFEITGYEEGKGGRTGTIGKFLLKTKSGEKFESNVKGDFAFLRDVWANKDTYVGTKATVKYFQLTPRGVPRFPLIIKLNREEYE